MGNIREREFYVLLGKDYTDSKWKIQRQEDCFYTITMGAEFISRSVSFVLKKKKKSILQDTAVQRRRSEGERWFNLKEW